MIVVVQKLEKRKSPPQQARAEGTPSLLEKEKRKKKIASADDNMLEFHRLSRKRNPQWLLRTLKKNQLLRIILRLHLHYSRDIEGIATPQKLGKGAAVFPFSIDIIMYHACKIYIYLLNQTRNL